MAWCVKEKTQMLEYFLDLTATCLQLLSRRRVSEFSRDPGTGRNSEVGGSALCAVRLQRK
jgi:hypothetical protein